MSSTDSTLPPSFRRSARFNSSTASPAHDELFGETPIAPLNLDFHSTSSAQTTEADIAAVDAQLLQEQLISKRIALARIREENRVGAADLQALSKLPTAERNARVRTIFSKIDNFSQVGASLDGDGSHISNASDAKNSADNSDDDVSDYDEDDMSFTSTISHKKVDHLRLSKKRPKSWSPLRWIVPTPKRPSLF